MSGATYAVPHFLGGEISQFAQGRFERPEYHTSMNVCFNAFPAEIGPWVRRPGTQFAGATRGGAKGRDIKFDFEQAIPYTLEFTDGFLRFRNGATLIATNDAQLVSSISTANPAVLRTVSATTWATGNTLIFGGLGTGTPLLQSRQFIATKIDTSHFSLTDALTGVSVDGSTLGAISAGATVSRLQELATPYTGGLWSNLRAVQAETTDILLSPLIPPQALTVPTLPSAGVNAVFAIGQAVFLDGPYLDPFINGVIANPNTGNGIITLTLSLPPFVSTTAYPVGAFVTSASINYVSLIDQNVGNTPASSPTAWQTTSAGAAINNGQGFLGSDVGRLVRMLTEPDLWVSTTTYAAGNFVSFNPTGQVGGETFWQSVAGGNIGNTPGADLTKWAQLPSTTAYWAWGKIVGLTTLISPTLSGSVNLSSMSSPAAAFDGTPSKPETACAFQIANVVSIDCSIGKDYSSASAQKIQSATCYPSSDAGFAFAGAGTRFDPPNSVTSVTINLRAKSTSPASPSDGILIGTTGPAANTTTPYTVNSTDTTTAYNYVWFEITANFASAQVGNTVFCSQAQFFSPPGTGVANGISVELLGPGLGYIAPIRTWRLGAYSNTTGWPTCGTYHEGRLWLGGAIPNRFDGCVSNGIVGNTVNFAPTDRFGVVANSNAISYVLNSDSVNPIFWMQPDLQGIILGTQAAEWLVQAPTTGPLSPSNIAARRVTKIGCANVEPRRTDHTTVFVQRFSQKLMEYFADVYSGKFSAPNIADKAQHITRAGIVELAYQSAVTPIIWGRDALGALFGLTYKRDTLTTAQGPTFAAWHRHALGSGRVIESLCAGPSVGGNLDALTMVTNDPATGVRHVELLTDTMDEITPLTDAWFLDDAVAPTSTVSTSAPSAGAPYGGLTLNGLWHLNGKTVQVFAGGLDCGDRGSGSTGFTDFLVTNGSCFVPYGDSVSAGCGAGLFTAAYVASISPFPIVVGFTYNSDGQLVRPISPADTGNRNGPALGLIRRNHRYAMLLANALGLSIGATFTKMFPALFKQPNGNLIDGLTMFSGVQQDSLQDDYGYDGMICWRVSRPYPANVVAISGNISTQSQ